MEVFHSREDFLFTTMTFLTRHIFATVGILLISSVATISAQDIADNRAHLKVLGGFSYSTLSGEDGVFGPYAGAGFDIRVSSQPVYVGASIEYMNKGFHHNSNHSFVVPFIGSYHIEMNDEMSIEPFAGTAISYGFNWKNWDCGLRLGCGLCVKRWDFTVAYDLGFRHYDFDFAEGRNQSLMLSASYNFSIN